MPCDKIKFTNKTTGDTILTEVVGLHIFKSFNELYKRFDKISLDYEANKNRIA